MRGYRLLWLAAILAGGLCAAWPFKLPPAPPPAPAERGLSKVVDVPLRRPDVLVEASGPDEVSPAGQLYGYAPGAGENETVHSRVSPSPASEPLLPPNLATHYTPLDDFHPTSWRPNPVAPLPKRSRPRQHRLTDGDSLETLAERYLGDRSRAVEIYEANREVLPAPDLLPLGRIIRIPPRQTDALTPAE